ncbi:MAG: nucleoside recognition domain-containing protein, partial [Myxococcota bacterium]
MNLILYVMVVVAFLTAAVREVTDPPVALSEADRAELVQTFDDGGSEAMVAWLAEHDAQAAIARSAGLGPQDLERELDEALSGSDGGEAAVAALERVGRFDFGEASPMTALGQGLFDMAKAAVLDVILPLIGIMAFFLGLMKVAEEAGVMAFLARLLRPVMVLLFPDIPPDHPAMSAIIMNMAANAAGLGNA